MMNKRLLGFLALGTGIIVGALSVFCNRDGDVDTDNPTPTVVRLRLKWIHQGQFAGFYCADQLGYYREAGVDVRIQPGGQDRNAIKLVTYGSDDIGVWGDEQILIARSRGMDVKAIGVVYQETAGCFVTRAAEGISKFEQIEGKRVGVQAGTDMDTLYRALCAINGVDRTRVKEIPVSTNFDLFLAGKLDVWPSYIVNEPYTAEAQSVKVSVLQPKDNGLHFYGDTIFCREKYLENNPQVVRSFLAATRKGWEYALDHPQEAAEACLVFDRTLDKEHQVYMVANSEPLIRPQGTEILSMEHHRWMQVHDVLRDQNLITTDVPVSQVFTSDYLSQTTFP